MPGRGPPLRFAGSSIAENLGARGTCQEPDLNRGTWLPVVEELLVGMPARVLPSAVVRAARCAARRNRAKTRRWRGLNREVYGVTFLVRLSPNSAHRSRHIRCRLLADSGRLKLRRPCPPFSDQQTSLLAPSMSVTEPKETAQVSGDTLPSGPCSVASG